MVGPLESYTENLVGPVIENINREKYYLIEDIKEERLDEGK